MGRGKDIIRGGGNVPQTWGVMNWGGGGGLMGRYYYAFGHYLVV